MKKLLILSLLTAALLTAGCIQNKSGDNTKNIPSELTAVTFSSNIVKLEDGFSAVKYEGDYGFDEYLAAGGASSDAEVVKFLAGNLLSNTDLTFNGSFLGCSTLSVPSTSGDMLFGRKFEKNEKYYRNF